jgi:hypothetical protein
LQLDQFIDVDKFLQEVDGGLDDLNEAMRTQTQMCAYYSIKHAGSEKQLGKVKLLDKTMRAATAKRIRGELAAAGEKATADLVKELVDLDPQVRQVTGWLIDAQEIETVCKAAMFAFRTRSEMITNMGHMTRAQMQGSMTVQNARTTAEDYRQRRIASMARTGVTDDAPAAT